MTEAGATIFMTGGTGNLGSRLMSPAGVVMRHSYFNWHGTTICHLAYSTPFGRDVLFKFCGQNRFRKGAIPSRRNAAQESQDVLNGDIASSSGQLAVSWLFAGEILQ